MTELEIVRRQKDRYLKIGRDSPIPHEQRADFVGLTYYPEKDGLRLVVQPEEFAEKESITWHHTPAAYSLDAPPCACYAQPSQVRPNNSCPCSPLNQSSSCSTTPVMLQREQARQR